MTRLNAAFPVVLVGIACAACGDSTGPNASELPVPGTYTFVPFADTDGPLAPGTVTVSNVGQSRFTIVFDVPGARTGQPLPAEWQPGIEPAPLLGPVWQAADPGRGVWYLQVRIWTRDTLEIRVRWTATAVAPAECTLVWLGYEDYHRCIMTYLRP